VFEDFVRLVHCGKAYLVEFCDCGALGAAVSLVKEIYQQNYISDRMINLGITKLTKETDVDNIRI